MNELLGFVTEVGKKILIIGSPVAVVMTLWYFVFERPRQRKEKKIIEILISLTK